MTRERDKERGKRKVREEDEGMTKERYKEKERKNSEIER